VAGETLKAGLPSGGRASRWPVRAGSILGHESPERLEEPVEQAPWLRWAWKPLIPLLDSRMGQGNSFEMRS
jgi:hypothetical protein